MSWFNNPQLQDCRNIHIKNFCCSMFIGAYEHERQCKQPVCLNVHVFVRSKNEHDNLSNAFNYDIVVNQLRRICSGNHIDLQETLIDTIANSLLEHPLVQAVLIRSEKTQAYSDVESVGIETFKIKK